MIKSFSDPNTNVPDTAFFLLADICSIGPCGVDHSVLTKHSDLSGIVDEVVKHYAYLLAIVTGDDESLDEIPYDDFIRKNTERFPKYYEENGTFLDLLREKGDMARKDSHALNTFISEAEKIASVLPVSMDLYVFNSFFDFMSFFYRHDADITVRQVFDDYLSQCV